MEMISTPTIGIPDAPVTQTTPIKETVAPAPVQQAPVEKKEPTPSSADLKRAIELKQESEAKKVDPQTPPAPIVKEGEVPQATPTEEWFDKERGFKTKDDFIASYKASQEKMRQQSEQLKSIDAELQSIKSREVAKTMSPEDRERMAAIEKWKGDNKDAIDLIKAEVKRDLDQETAFKDFERSTKQEMNDWKQKFDADPERNILKPKMDELVNKEVVLDSKGQPLFKGFLQNPLKYYEALAFREEFPKIAERLKQEAVEQYKKSVKEAAEAERKSTTALPGGPKSTGEVDVSKMSASQLANLLPRKED